MTREEGPAPPVAGSARLPPPRLAALGFGRGAERAAVTARARALLETSRVPDHVGADRPVADPPAGAVPGGWVPPPLADGPDGDDPADPPPRTGWRERYERIRFDPGRRGLTAVAAVVVVVAAVAGGVLLGNRPASAALDPALTTGPAGTAPVTAGTGARPPGPASTPPTGTSAGTSSPPTPLVVDVAGLVAHPGVYRLPAGARVQDAITAAGGPLPGADLTTVNQARTVVDGEQIAIGVPGAAPNPGGLAGAGGPVGAGTSAGGAVDLNTADLGGLETLPGVGPVLAQRILDWRAAHGRFARVEDLQQVSGIGPTRFADLKNLVRV